MPLRFSPNRGAAALSLNALVRGPTGAAATITAGTTTTGAEGSSAAVSNSGSSSAAIFDFTIPRGAVPAIGWNFDTTTTDADPGAGDVRFNNATPASVTEIYFDNVDRDGATQTTFLDSLDDSTTTSKGHLVFTPAATPSARLIYAVSGTVVDGTGYRKVTVTHVGGTTLPSSAAHLAVAFYRTGDKGADGSVTVSGTPNSGEYARWTGATTLEARTASQVRTDLGLSTADSPQFTALNVGAATDTTITRTGAGDIAVEGNAIYRAGGTDVPVTDGGTGASSAAAAATNLGLGTGDSPEFTGVNVGHASDTTITRSAAGVIAVEGVPLYSNIPQNSQSAAYTTVLADAQKHILHPTADNNARTFTIDSNANVAYPIGTAITFINQINTVTISITSDTMTLAGPGTTGSRTLAANGMATAIKVGTTNWVISGTGLT